VDAHPAAGPTSSEINMEDHGDFQRKANRLLCAQGNPAERGRAGDRPNPRGTIISSAESLPRGIRLRDRTLVLLTTTNGGGCDA
jgi:hypothetical protein